MSIHRFRRIDRRTAEQLLRGAPTSGRPAAPSSAHALGELLSAAAAPAREGELAGEQAAMAAFRSTQLAPVPQLRSRSMIKTTLATLLTAKILAPAAAAAAVGGITLASVTGTLPLPGDSPAGPPADKVTTAPSHSATTPAGKDGTPSPSLVGLCRAYTSGAGAEQGKAHESPAFQALITEAGGEDNVAEYCADVIADRPGKPETVPSSQRPTPAHPTGEPAARPRSAPEEIPSRPNGSPAERPTTAPTAPAEQPTSAPASKPATTPSYPAGAPGSARDS